MKRILIIAGPNGAGKTTFANQFLPGEAKFQEFVNADLIAAGLSPFQPEQVAFTAGRLMLERIRILTASGRDFAFETTLSTRCYLRLIPKWQACGYRVNLCFLQLPDPEFAIRRVAQRVQLGGHDIPSDTIRRRFARGLALLQDHYLPLVDEWSIYDSSLSPHQLLSVGRNPPPSSLMEDSPPYPRPADSTEEIVLPKDSAFHGADAALARAAAKAVERARAAGLEPITTFRTPPSTN